MKRSLSERVPQAGAEDRERRAELERWVQDQGVRWIRLAAPDLHGVLRAKLIPASRWSEVVWGGHPWGARLLAVDLHEDLDPSTAYDPLIHLGNGVLLPDPGARWLLPWQTDTALVLGDPHEVDGTPMPSARHALSEVAGRLAREGLRAVVGCELELSLYRGTPEGLRPISDGRSFYSDRALSGAQPELTDLLSGITEMGIVLEDVEFEHGPGQLELNLHHEEVCRAADLTVVLRAAVKELAKRSGGHATFMARPDNGEETNTCGFHLHQALWRSETNIFAARGGVSRECLAYIAGQLAHAPALTALASPTVTGYKRLRPGTFAPLAPNWGFDDRRAMIRVMREGINTRLENRLGEAAANPYLLMASQLAAGRLGVKAKLDPGAPITAQDAVQAGAHGLPADLGQAASALDADRELRHELGDQLCGWVAGAMRSTWGRFLGHVTDWEREEYFQAI